MPTLQVIQRQEDPDYKLLRDTGNDVADSILKAKTLQATKHYYDIQAKNAETEAQKQDLEKKKQYLDLMDRVQKISDPDVRSAVATQGLKILHAGDKNGMDTMAGVGEDMQAIMKNLRPDTGSASTEQVAGAQAANYRSEADLNSTLANQLRAATAVGGAVAGGVGGQPSTPGTPGANGYMPGDINIKGIQFVNPAAKQAEAGAQATGTGLANKAIAHQQFARDFETFKAIQDQIPRSKGGILNMGAQGTKNAWSALNQNSPQGQLLSAYDAASKRFATTLARQVDVGNLSENEQQAASKMIPDLNDSQGTARIKMAFIADMNRAIGSNESSKVKEIIANYQKQLNPRANLINGNKSAKPTSGRFTIEKVE